MPTRGSSWVQCISARLEPPNVYSTQLRNDQPPPPKEKNKGPQRPTRKRETENGEAVAKRVLRLYSTHYPTFYRNLSFWIGESSPSQEYPFFPTKAKRGQKK